MLVTTWKTPGGLGGGPRRADDGAARRTRTRSRRTPARRPTTTPTTCWCGRSSASTARSRWSWSASRPSTTAGRPAEWTLVDGDRHTADAAGGGQTVRLDRSLARHRRQPRARAPHAPGGRARATARSRGPRASPRRRTSTMPRRGSTPRALLARWLGAGTDPRPPVARPDPALGARDQGPHVHADRCDGRGAHDVAARDARRRAELGLPLHLDARHDLHAAGAALAEPGLGGRRVHAVRRRPRAERGRRRCRSCTASTAAAT